MAFEMSQEDGCSGDDKGDGVVEYVRVSLENKPVKSLFL